MFYDYEDEDFYTENEYQEEIDNLKEAIKKSVKREITEEMNRLREENKKLQGIKENFDTVKKDFERKKDECDRAIRNAEYNARCARITELMEKFKIVMWSVTWENLYKQKCDKCDSWRKVKIALPSLEEQNEIVKIITSISNKDEAILNKAEAVIEEIDLMKKSILAKAFRGELGTNISKEKNSIEVLKKLIEEESK